MNNLSVILEYLKMDRKASKYKDPSTGATTEPLQESDAALVSEINAVVEYTKDTRLGKVSNVGDLLTAATVTVDGVNLGTDVDAAEARVFLADSQVFVENAIKYHLSPLKDFFGIPEGKLLDEYKRLYCDSGAKAPAPLENIFNLLSDFFKKEKHTVTSYFKKPVKGDEGGYLFFAYDAGVNSGNIEGDAPLKAEGMTLEAVRKTLASSFTIENGIYKSEFNGIPVSLTPEDVGASSVDGLNKLHVHLNVRSSAFENVESTADGDGGAAIAYGDYSIEYLAKLLGVSAPSIGYKEGDPDEVLASVPDIEPDSAYPISVASTHYVSDMGYPLSFPEGASFNMPEGFSGLSAVFSLEGVETCFLCVNESGNYTLASSSNGNRVYVKPTRVSPASIDADDLLLKPLQDQVKGKNFLGYETILYDNSMVSAALSRIPLSKNKTISSIGSKALVPMASPKPRPAGLPSQDIFDVVQVHLKTFRELAKKSPSIKALLPLAETYLDNKGDRYSAFKTKCDPLSFAREDQVEFICRYITYVEKVRDVQIALASGSAQDVKLLYDAAVASTNSQGGAGLYSSNTEAFSKVRNAQQALVDDTAALGDSIRNTEIGMEYLKRNGVLMGEGRNNLLPDRWGDWIAYAENVYISSQWAKKNGSIPSCSSIINDLEARTNAIFGKGLSLFNGNPRNPASIYKKYKDLCGKIINMLRELQVRVYFQNSLSFDTRNSFRAYVETVVQAFTRYTRKSNRVPNALDAARIICIFEVLTLDRPPYSKDKPSASVYDSFIAHMLDREVSPGFPDLPKKYTLIDVANNLLDECLSGGKHVDTDYRENAFSIDDSRAILNEYGSVGLVDTLETGVGLDMDLTDPVDTSSSGSNANKYVQNEGVLLRYGDHDVEGSKGGPVWKLQSLLHDKWPNVRYGATVNSNLDIDGRFETHTLAAVKGVQTASGLVPTGVVDNKTWEAIAKGPGK